MRLDAYLHHQIIEAQTLARLHQRDISVSQSELSLMRDTLALIAGLAPEEVEEMDTGEVAHALLAWTCGDVADRVPSLITTHALVV